MERAADETRDRHRAGEGQSRFHSSPSERIICRQENQRDCFEFRAVRRFPSLLADATEERLVDVHSAASGWLGEPCIFRAEWNQRYR